MATPKTISTFAPQTARQIAKYVSDRLPHGATPFNPIVTTSPAWRKCFAKITGNATIGSIKAHSWIEQRWNYSTKAFENAPDGRSGTTSFNYLVVFPETDTALDTDTIVEATRVEDGDTGVNVWLASSVSLPIGQYQFMVYQMVASNTAGFDYVRSHPTI